LLKIFNQTHKRH